MFCGNHLNQDYETSWVKVVSSLIKNLIRRTAFGFHSKAFENSIVKAWYEKYMRKESVKKIKTIKKKRLRQFKRIEHCLGNGLELLSALLVLAVSRTWFIRFSLPEVSFINDTGIVQINRMVVKHCVGRNIRTFYLINRNDQRIIYLINLNDQRINLFISVCVQCGYEENATFCTSLQFQRLNDIDRFQVQLNLNTI